MSNNVQRTQQIDFYYFVKRQVQLQYGYSFEKLFNSMYTHTHTRNVYTHTREFTWRERLTTDRALSAYFLSWLHKSATWKRIVIVCRNARITIIIIIIINNIIVNIFIIIIIIIVIIIIIIIIIIIDEFLYLKHLFCHYPIGTFALIVWYITILLPCPIPQKRLIKHILVYQYYNKSPSSQYCPSYRYTHNCGRIPAVYAKSRVGHFSW